MFSVSSFKLVTFKYFQGHKYVFMTRSDVSHEVLKMEAFNTISLVA